MKEVKLTLSGSIIYQKQQFAVLDMNDFSEMYIVIDTSKENEPINYSYYYDNAVNMIEELV